MAALWLDGDDARRSGYGSAAILCLMVDGIEDITTATAIRSGSGRLRPDWSRIATGMIENHDRARHC